MCEYFDENNVQHYHVIFFISFIYCLFTIVILDFIMSANVCVCMCVCVCVCFLAPHRDIVPVIRETEDTLLNHTLAQSSKDYIDILKRKYHVP